MSITVSVFLLAGPSHSTLSDLVQIGDALATDINPDGSFTYELPEGLAADNYRIKLVSGGLSDTSDGFNVHSDTATTAITTYNEDRTGLDIKIQDNVLRLPMGKDYPAAWYGYIDRKFATYRNSDNSAYVEHKFKDYYYDDSNIPVLPLNFAYVPITLGNTNDETSVAAGNVGVTENHDYKYKITTTYDNNQESALTEGGIEYNTQTNAINTIKLTFRYGITNWNPRITHLNIYRAMDYVEDDKLNTYYKIATIDLSDPDVGVTDEIQVVPNRGFMTQTFAAASSDAVSEHLEATDPATTRKGACFFMKSPFVGVSIKAGNSYITLNTCGRELRWSAAGWTATSSLVSESGNPSNITNAGHRNYVDFEKTHPMVMGRVNSNNLDNTKKRFDALPYTLTKWNGQNWTYNTSSGYYSPASGSEYTGPYVPTIPYTDKDSGQQEKDLSYPIVAIPDHNASNVGAEVRTHYIVNRDAPSATTETYYLLDNYNMCNFGSCWWSGGYKDDTDGSGSVDNILDGSGDTDSYTDAEGFGWYTSNGSSDDSYGELKPGAILMHRNSYHAMSNTNMKLENRMKGFVAEEKYVFSLSWGVQITSGNGRYAKLVIQYKDGSNQFQHLVNEETGGAGFAEARVWQGEFTTPAGILASTEFRIGLYMRSSNAGTGDKRYFITQCGIFKVLNGTGVDPKGVITVGGNGTYAVDGSLDTVAHNATRYGDGELIGRTLNIDGVTHPIALNLKTLLQTNSAELETTDGANQLAILRPRTEFVDTGNGIIEGSYIDTGTYVGPAHYLGLTNLNTYYKYSQFIEGRNYVGNVQIFAGSEKAEKHENWVMYSELGKPDIIPATNFIQLDDLQGGEIIGMKRLYGDLCVLMTKGIYRLSLNSVNPTGWSLKESEPNIGCIAPESIISYENAIFFAGAEAFYMLDTNFNATALTSTINSEYQSYKGVGIKCSIDILNQELHMKLPGIAYQSYILSLNALNQQRAEWRIHSYSTSEVTAGYATDENYQLHILRNKNFSNFKTFTKTVTATASSNPDIQNNVSSVTDTNIDTVVNGSQGYIKFTGVNVVSTYLNSTRISVEGLEANDGIHKIVSVTLDGSDTLIKTNSTLVDSTDGATVTVTKGGPFSLTFTDGLNPITSLDYTPTYLNIEGPGLAGPYNNAPISSITSNTITFEPLENEFINDVTGTPKLTSSTSTDLTFTTFDGDETIIDSKDSFLYNLNPSVSTEPVSLARTTGFIVLSEDDSKGVGVRRMHIDYESNQEWQITLTYISSTTVSSYTPGGLSRQYTIPTTYNGRQRYTIRPSLGNVAAVSIGIMVSSSIFDFKLYKLSLEVD